MHVPTREVWTMPKTNSFVQNDGTPYMHYDVVCFVTQSCYTAKHLAKCFFDEGYILVFFLKVDQQFFIAGCFNYVGFFKRINLVNLVKCPNKQFSHPFLVKTVDLSTIQPGWSFPHEGRYSL